MKHLDIIRSKIVDRATLKKRAFMWQFREFDVVFTNGCFDLIHYGHVSTLSLAKDMGDILVVGINTDESVKRLKGPSRPLIHQDERAMMLAALHFVDAVIMFSADTPIEVIRFLKPHVLIKGGDWDKNEIVGSDVVQSYGGRVEVAPYLDGFSTTSMINKIKDS